MNNPYGNRTPAAPCPRPDKPEMLLGSRILDDMKGMLTIHSPMNHYGIELRGLAARPTEQQRVGMDDLDKEKLWCFGLPSAQAAGVSATDADRVTRCVG